jgi:hypothetical protein
MRVTLYAKYYKDIAMVIRLQNQLPCKFAIHFIKDNHYALIDVPDIDGLIKFLQELGKFGVNVMVLDYKKIIHTTYKNAKKIERMYPTGVVWYEDEFGGVILALPLTSKNVLSSDVEVILIERVATSV